MQIYVLTGDDTWALRARRTQLREQFETASFESVDLSIDGGSSLLATAATISMFGDLRFIDASPAADLSETAAAGLAALADGPAQTVVVIHGEKALAAAAKTTLAKSATYETFPAPRTPAAVATRLAALAAEQSVTLDGPARALLTDRSGHDLGRAASVIAQCAMVGLHQPNAGQLGTLLGTSAAPGVPWALADAIESGDLATALSVAQTVEPIPAVGYLASRLANVGRIVDADLVDVTQISAALGLTNPRAATGLLRLARRLGPAGVARSWDLLAAGDRAVKVATDPRGEFDLLLVKLARLWSGSDTLTVLPNAAAELA